MRYELVLAPLLPNLQIISIYSLQRCWSGGSSASLAWFKLTITHIQGGHRYNLSVFKNSAASQDLPWLCIIHKVGWLHLQTCTEPWLGLESALPLAGL